MTMTDTEDRLPCGVEVGSLLDQVGGGRGRGRTAHQQSCVFCQAALAEVAFLWEPLQALASEHVVAPPGLVGSVMAQVHRVAARVWYAVLPDARGSTRIASRVIAVIARQAALGVPGVRAALGRSTEPRRARAAEAATSSHRYPGTAVGVAGSHVAIDLALATTYGASIPAVADEVRRAVTRDVRTATGVQDVVVAITVDDLLTDEVPGPT